MSTETAIITSVVEPMLDHAGSGRLEGLEDVLDEQSVTVEPDASVWKNPPRGSKATSR